MIEGLAPPLRLSGHLLLLAERCAGERVTFRTLLPGLDSRDHALLTLFLALCFMHPFPIPGISQILGIMIVIAGARMSQGLGPWIPERWLDHGLPGGVLGKVLGFSGRQLRRVEYLIKPRGRFLTAHPWVRRLNGAAIVCCGLLVLLPLPPPTNFPPAIALMLLSIGVAEDDVVLLGLGYAALLATTVLFGAILVLGMAGVRMLFFPVPR
ncbi:MAG: exopolysaccharide biosynthesis protein [Elusimicrobiota bacterium]